MSDVAFGFVGLTAFVWWFVRLAGLVICLSTVGVLVDFRCLGLFLLFVVLRVICWRVCVLLFGLACWWLGVG